MLVSVAGWVWSDGRYFNRKGSPMAVYSYPSPAGNQLTPAERIVLWAFRRLVDVVGDDVLIVPRTELHGNWRSRVRESQANRGG
jgi:hypothetical protein